MTTPTPRLGAHRYPTPTPTPDDITTGKELAATHITTRLTTRF